MYTNFKVVSKALLFVFLIFPFSIIEFLFFIYMLLYLHMVIEAIENMHFR
jgi:hypothetical protein